MGMFVGMKPDTRTCGLTEKSGRGWMVVASLWGVRRMAGSRSQERVGRSGRSERR